ncbi:MAG: RlmF-related methyltransferase [Prolixibacteraceae bacterium]|jgi:23S rRNA (adenine1618-N6)-methyltransferase|nr:RlmF-related methyltransferase [Prolixibacteraceae bacterium]
MPAKGNPEKGSRYHVRNRNREKYNLEALLTSNPELANHLKPNIKGEDSVDLSNPDAVKVLNQAILNHYYGITNWNFPKEYLSPSVPLRADYIHFMADLLCEHNFGKIPTGDIITCYDIGIGASCILPLIGVVDYNWNFIGADIDEKVIESASNIVESNTALKGKITCKLQENPKDAFYGIIDRDEKIDVSICSCFSSDEGTKFISNILRESKKFAQNFYWFSIVVSNKIMAKNICISLARFKPTQIKTIPIGSGTKANQIVAWTFLSKVDQTTWKISRWNKK